MEDCGKYLNDPDQIIESTDYITFKPDGVVKLRAESVDKIVSVPTLIKNTAQKYPNHVAIKFKNENGRLEQVTYKEYENVCRTAAKGFLKMGLERHHSVCILGFNSPEYMYCAIGAILAGGFEAGIYPTNSPEACLHCLLIGRANIAIVEDEMQLKKILSIKHKAPYLKAIVQLKGKPNHTDVLSWQDVLNIGNSEPDSKLEQVLKTMAVNECCAIVYTSGTTGMPKGVMLSHDNVITGARNLVRDTNLLHGCERILSYLPMSHIASQITDLFAPWTVAATVYVADKNVLKSTLVENIKEARPTVFLGVPRVWEKLKDVLEEAERRANFVYKWLLKLARRIALNHYRNLSYGKSSNGILLTLMEYLVYWNVKCTIGIEKSKKCITGSAPTFDSTREFFYSINMPLVEAYGLSETGGLCSMCTESEGLSGVIGRTTEDVSMKIKEPDGKGNGEILINGRSIFMGYINSEEKTREAFDEDGWFRSGDLGSCSSTGIFKITGRLKELIITAGGENIPAPLIESAVKSELPVVSNAVLIGDKMKYLTILLTLKCEIDSQTGAPTDELTTEVKVWCKHLGYDCSSVDDIIANKPKVVYDAIQTGIDEANLKAISNAQKIQKFAILPRDFSIATGELSPTLKLKRSVVTEKYADIIDSMY